jgi:predicted HTH transcriptional regulator
MNSSGYLSDCSRSRMRANGSSSSRTWLNSDEIGEYISALSNAANLHSESKGYLVWGVEDETHRVGTTFDLALAKKGSQSLHLWLLAALRPEPAIEFSTGMVDSHRMAIVEISAATHHPVQFSSREPHTSASTTTRRSLKTILPTPNGSTRILTRRRLRSAPPQAD